MRAVNDVLGQAFDTRNILSSQRSTLAGANSGASGMTSKFLLYSSHTNLPVFDYFRAVIDGLSCSHRCIHQQIDGWNIKEKIERKYGHSGVYWGTALFYDMVGVFEMIRVV